MKTIEIAKLRKWIENNSSLIEDNKRPNNPHEVIYIQNILSYLNKQEKLIKE